MPNTAIVDIKEQFCYIAVFAEGWKGNKPVGSAIVRGSFLDKTENTARKVKEEIDRLSPYDCSVVLLMPRSMVQVMSLEIPAKDETTLKKMMQFEVTRRFPVQQDQLIYDYFVVDRVGDRFVVNLAGFKREDFDDYFNTAQYAGIKAESFSLSSAAWIPPEGDTSSNRTYIEIIPEGFELSMVEGRRVAYSRFIRFKPKIEEAHFFTRDAMAGSMSSRIADNISAELSHAGLVSGIEQIASYLEKVYLAGGGTLQLNIENALALKTGFSANAITPLKAEGDEAGFGHVASAVGSAGSGKKYRFNFIPPELRHKSNIAAKRLLKSAVAIIGLLLFGWLGSFYIVQMNTLNALKDDLKRLRSEVSTIEKTQIEIDEFKTYFDSFNSFSKRPALSLEIVDELTSLLPRSTFLTDMEIKKNEITIAGISSDAASLLEVLESSKQFKGVRMAGAVKSFGSKEKFKIVMEYE